jgi:hypothetical protein
MKGTGEVEKCVYISMLELLGVKVLKAPPLQSMMLLWTGLCRLIFCFICATTFLLHDLELESSVKKHVSRIRISLWWLNWMS